MLVEANPEPATVAVSLLSRKVVLGLMVSALVSLPFKHNRLCADVGVQKMSKISNSITEHSAMYQIAIHNARGVYLGVHQSESAYWQVQTKASTLNPGSWSSALYPGEPKFDWCAATDGSVCEPSYKMCCAKLIVQLQCRVGLYQYVSGSSDVHLYSGGFWNFPCMGDSCQTYATVFANNTKLFVWGQGVINSKNMVGEVSGSTINAIATRQANIRSNFNGLTPSIIAAYLRQSG